MKPIIPKGDMAAVKKFVLPPLKLKDEDSQEESGSSSSGASSSGGTSSSS